MSDGLAAGLLRATDADLCLTPRGRLVASEALIGFLPPVRDADAAMTQRDAVPA